MNNGLVWYIFDITIVLLLISIIIIFTQFGIIEVILKDEGIRKMNE